jgi:hypothetical protein
MNFKEITMETNQLDLVDFAEMLRADIEECFREGNTIEAFLKNQYGIMNVMDHEFSDLKDKKQSDFHFNKIRGNTRLMEGNIRTYMESQEFMDKALSNDFAKLKV